MESPVEPQPDARRVIEKALWTQGITGETCALVADRVLTALVEAGLVRQGAPD
jgi:hypothetical protein